MSHQDHVLMSALSNRITQLEKREHELGEHLIDLHSTSHDDDGVLTLDDASRQIELQRQLKEVKDEIKVIINEQVTLEQRDVQEESEGSLFNSGTAMEHAGLAIAATGIVLGVTVALVRFFGLDEAESMSLVTSTEGDSDLDIAI